MFIFSKSEDYKQRTTLDGTSEVQICDADKDCFGSTLMTDFQINPHDLMLRSSEEREP